MAAVLARLVQESDLPSSVMHCAVCCALYADEAGHGAPSIGDLMWLLGKSERQMLRETAALRRLGVLKVTGRNGKKLAFRVNAAALRPKSLFVSRETHAKGGGS